MHFDNNVFLMVMVFMIPIIAIVLGVAHRIVQTLGEQRLMELAQRERIAAIERGIDPSKLPPIGGGNHDPGAHAYGHWGYRNGSPLRRAHGLLIGGLVTFAVGIGVALFLGLMETEKNAWSIGLIPMLVGVALLAGAVVIWPRGTGGGQTPPPMP